MHHGNDGNVVIATESGSYDGISISTISHTSPTMATDQQLAALSQFTSNIQSHHDHDQTTLYVLQDPSAGHHDGDHQHVRYRDYFMVGECVRFLFTSCEGSLNERVSAANE